MHWSNRHGTIYSQRIHRTPLMDSWDHKTHVDCKTKFPWPFQCLCEEPLPLFTLVTFQFFSFPASAHGSLCKLFMLMYLCLYAVILVARHLNNELVCLQEPTQRTHARQKFTVICGEGKTFNCACVIASFVSSCEIKKYSHVILFHSAKWYQASYTHFPQG